MLPEIANTPVFDIALREPARAAQSATLLDVVTQMRELRRGAVIVEDDAGALVGVFTERDLMLRVSQTDLAWHERVVGDVMTAQPHTATADTSIADALALMEKHTFRHLPVVDADGAATALVSIRDILAHIVDHFPREFINLPPDPDHEANKQWGG